MNRVKLAPVGVFLQIAAFALGLSGCSNEHRIEAAAPEMVSDVAVVVARRTAVPDWLEAVGTVRAAQTSRVSSEMMGKIIEIRAHEGDRVQSGQVLATIDDAQPRAAMDQATASVTATEKELAAADSEFALAQTTLQRYQQLYEKKSVSPQEFDEIKTRYQSAEARRDSAKARLSVASAMLSQAQTSLSYAQIRAPFAGIVTEKLADAGTLASPGMPLFTLEDTRSFRFEATVDESEIRIARVAQSVSVAIDALGAAQISGRVAQIVPAADPASRTFLVKIQLPADARLRSGLFGRARFPRGRHAAMLIPRAAVVDRGQLQGVYVLDSNQIAGLRYVTLGQSNGDKVEVLSGLQDGEKFVAAPEGRELGGKQVSPRQ